MPSKKSIITAALGAAALTVPLVAFAGSASAAQRGSFHLTRVITNNVIGPLQIAVASHSVFVADAFTSTLHKAGSNHVIARGGDPNKGGDISGVAIDVPSHDLAYLKSNGDHSNTKFVVLHRGKVSLSRNLASYEAKHNPDGKIRYGVEHASSCARKALRDAHVPVTYKGQKDSHPYSVAFLGNHTWAVGDAGGNDILIINSATGKISTLAVLPRQPFIVSKAFASANHIASCAIGTTYFTESVPTDVELGPNGTLYASTLPGGPEGPGVGPRGRIYTISRSGAVKIIGHSFGDATNIAVTPTGIVYVAELAEGRISVLHNAKPRTVYHLPAVVAIEWAYNRLYAATAPAVNGAKSKGRVVVLEKS